MDKDTRDAKRRAASYFENPLDREFWLIVLTTWTYDEVIGWSEYAEKTIQSW